MADNNTIRDGDNDSFIVATDELADGAKSPKVTILKGDSTATPLAIADVLGATSESAAASDTATAGLNAFLKRLCQRITSLIALFPASLGTKTKAASLAVTLASDEDARKTSRSFARVTAQNTRPAHTTADARGDAVGPAAGAAVFTFTAAAASAGGQGSIRGAFMTKTSTNVTLATFRLSLYQGTPSAAPAADNDAYVTAHHSDRTLYVGYIDFLAPVAGTSNGTLYENGTMSRPELFFDITASGVDLIGILTAFGAYVPTSGETFYISLDEEQGK